MRIGRLRFVAVLLAVLILDVIVFQGCRRSAQLTREMAKTALSANQHYVIASYLHSFGFVLPGGPDPNDDTFSLNGLEVTGISKATDATATVTFTATVVTKSSGKGDEMTGAARFRLFDDGWRIDTDSVTAKSK